MSDTIGSYVDNKKHMFYNNRGGKYGWFELDKQSISEKKKTQKID